MNAPPNEIAPTTDCNLATTEIGCSMGGIKELYKYLKQLKPKSGF